MAEICFLECGGTAKATDCFCEFKTLTWGIDVVVSSIFSSSSSSSSVY